MIYIILQDYRLIGYVSDESTAKLMVLNMVEKLTKTLREIPDTRVFQENVENVENAEVGINIYTQAQGQLFNGPITKRHTVVWRRVDAITYPEPEGKTEPNSDM